MKDEKEQTPLQAITLLTIRETMVLRILSKAWAEFLFLPNLQSTDINDFRAAIHATMRIVLARPGRRQIEEREDPMEHPTPSRPKESNN